MDKTFKLVTITTKDNPDPGYLGYLCDDRATIDDIRESSLPGT